MAAETSGYLYHLAPVASWNASKAAAQPYTPATYQQDGFIHLTADPQLLLGVANHFYKASQGDWLLLVVDQSALTSKVVFEAAAAVGSTEAVQSDALFPHLYGPLNHEAVKAELLVARAADGTFLSIQGLAAFDAKKQP